MNLMLADVLILTCVAVVVGSACYGIGRHFQPPPEALPHDERLDLMHAKAKHRIGMLLYASLILIGVVTFVGLVDISNSTISALIVQFLNTIKDLAMGPSYSYFPRTEPPIMDRPGENHP